MIPSVAIRRSENPPVLPNGGTKMSKITARKPRDWFLICSWIALIVVFTALVLYMSLHVEDLLDADMSSEMVLAQQLKQTGGILSSNWYYSTEVRALNTQLVYDLFFHISSDWQTVRLLGNVMLYLVLLGSYYFLCKRLRIARYYPITAAILLLPLSAPYFYILLYGAYYIPRVSILFVILGLVLSERDQPYKTNRVIISTLLACALSLAQGLEGARMLLILFIPLAMIVGAEFALRVVSRRGQTPVALGTRMQADGFPLYFVQSLLVCVSAVAGFWINQRSILPAYPFEQYGAWTPKLTLGSIKTTAFNQLHLIGSGPFADVLSLLVWAITGALIVWYLFRKGQKSPSALRFVWLAFISWVCYSVFCSLIDFGQVAWHMVPMAVLWIPAVALILKEGHLLPAIRRSVCIGLIAGVLLSAIPGYMEFGNWSNRKDIRTSDSYQQIASTLENQGYHNGYATFWNANILTELSDGTIDVWCVDTFGPDTPSSPDLYRWLQVKSHDHTLPTGRTFVVWTAQEYDLYGKERFTYLGKLLYQDDDFVVFDVN